MSIIILNVFPVCTTNSIFLLYWQCSGVTLLHNVSSRSWNVTNRCDISVVFSRRRWTPLEWMCRCGLGDLHLHPCDISRAPLKNKSHIPPASHWTGWLIINVKLQRPIAQPEAFICVANKLTPFREAPWGSSAPYAGPASVVATAGDWSKMCVQNKLSAAEPRWVPLQQIT